jgi:hypothetical protein
MPGIDPLSLGVQGVGLGLEIYGGIQQSKIAKEKAAAEMQQAGLEKQINEVRRQTMETQNRRSQMEQVRRGQIARSMALETGASQGAQFGSALGGAAGSISGQIGSNILGMSQALQFGEKTFDLQNEISDIKMTEAKLGSQAAEWAGISAIGGGLMSLGGSKSLSGR